MNKSLLRVPTAISLLLISLTAIAELPINSIRMIHPSNFGIDYNDLTAIKSQMQAAVDSGHLPGAMLLVGNDKGVGVLLTVGTQGPDDAFR